MRRRLRAAVDFAIVAIVGVALAGAVGWHAIAASGQQPVVIAGGSMEPTIPVGALAIARPVPAADLRPADVVLVQPDSGRSPYTHRVTRLVERHGDVWLELQGDANATPDAVLVPAAAVVGRIGGFVPLAGRFVSALAAGGLLVVFGVAGLLYTISLALEPGYGASRPPRRSGISAAVPVGGPPPVS